MEKETRDTLREDAKRGSRRMFSLLLVPQRLPTDRHAPCQPQDVLLRAMEFQEEKEKTATGKREKGEQEGEKCGWEEVNGARGFRFFQIAFDLISFCLFSPFFFSSSSLPPLSHLPSHYAIYHSFLTTLCSSSRQSSSTVSRRKESVLSRLSG